MEKLNQPKIKKSSLDKALTKISKEEMLAIHKAIHDKKRKVVNIKGKKFSIIENNKVNCRQIQFGNILFSQQKSDTISYMSEMSKNGEKITLGINYGEWFVIHNNKLFDNRREFLNYLDEIEI